MKKVILFITAMLLTGTAVQATDQKNIDHQDRVTNRYRTSPPIVFIEGGITFLVYSNGEVDFKTPRRKNHRQDTHWNTRYNNAPGHSRNHRSNRKYAVRYDYSGRLKQIGHTSISHNKFDQVRRIGTVMMRYNRRGLVSQIGGLYINYDKYRNIKHFTGDIHNTGCNICGITRCQINHTSYKNIDKKSNRYNKTESYKNRKKTKTHGDSHNH